MVSKVAIMKPQIRFARDYSSIAEPLEVERADIKKPGIGRVFLKDVRLRI
ncbi:hypothetical protein NBRC116585_02460 [Thalassolituus maritimus]|uniref:Uncharacterized protein n=1 Tax=Thalassolituus maritimus TaxID=484498 RepID=A0ABP9ZVF9_9GAMM